MKKLAHILTNRLFSIQLKKALFYAFIEARKNKTNIIDCQTLLYGILKTNNGIGNRVLNKLFKSNRAFKPVDKILTKINWTLANKAKSSSFKTGNNNPNFSRTVRRLLFFLLRLTKAENCSVITTLDVLKYLLRNKYVKKFVKESLG